MVRRQGVDQLVTAHGTATLQDEIGEQEASLAPRERTLELLPRPLHGEPAAQMDSRGVPFHARNVARRPAAGR